MNGYETLDRADFGRDADLDRLFWRDDGNPFQWGTGGLLFICGGNIPFLPGRRFGGGAVGGGTGGGQVLESYEKQKRFITDAGHEIKTPVTIIDADAEVLAMDLGENEWLRDIQVQTKRLAALTKDLVFLSRMEEDRPQLEKIAFPFSDLVSETAQSFQGLAKAQNKTVQLSIQPMITLVGEEKSLRQLVSILLDNALKYSKEGGWIRLSLERQRKTVFLTVENSTDAPLPQRLEDLFERFYRGDSSRNSQTGGYGLGLSIAKAIVETHGGRIGASRDGADHLRIQVQLPAGPSEREERQQEE